MAYRAQQQSLFGQVGAPNAPQYAVDIPGTIGALTDSASSFIHQTYLRRNAEHQQALQEEQQRIQREQMARQNARQDEQFAYTKEKDAADREFKNKELRQKGLENGITPGTEGGTTVAIAPEPVVAPEPVGAFTQPVGIKAAMTSGFNPTPAPTSALETPVTKGSLGTTPTLTYGEEAATPDTYDPKKAAAYVRSTETANIRAQAAQDIEQQRESARAALQADRLTYMRETSKQLAKMRADANGGGGPGGKGGKALTANAREAAAANAALGLIDKAGGSYDTAEQELNGENGKEFREFGVTSRHLLAAKAKWKAGATKAALTLQGGATGLSVDEAVGRVGETGAKIEQSAKPPAKQLVKPGAAKGQPAFDAEAAKYQEIVKHITDNFTGKDRDDRLKKASDIYNSRVAAVAGAK